MPSALQAVLSNQHKSLAVAVTVLKFIFHILLGCGVCGKNKPFPTAEILCLQQV